MPYEHVGSVCIQARGCIALEAVLLLSVRECEEYPGPFQKRQWLEVIQWFL